VNILSLFDGMSCGQIALERAGLAVDNYYASEIDKWAIKVTKANYPDTVHVGKVEHWQTWDLMYGVDWSDIDLIMGGSPCQGFSFAGKQLAFDDPRSKLFFTFVDIVNHAKKHNPGVKFLLENVRMKKEHLDVITDHLGVYPVFINSALVSAQSRQRYYWANWEFGLPEDRGIMLADVILKDAPSVLTHSSKAVGYMNRVGSTGRSKWSYKFHSEEAKGKSQCLTANYHKGVPNNVLVEETGRVRKFDCVECERLQTVPDNYTDLVSNTQRYKILGNGWTVDVIAHILKALKDAN